MINKRGLKISFMLLLLLALPLVAQEKERTKTVVKLEESKGKSVISTSGVRVEVDELSDTLTTITLGTRRLEIIDDYNRPKVKMVRLPREKFKGHWAGCEIGFNGYMTSGFSSDLPNDALFMDLNSSKSVQFSINFLQYNISLQQQKNNIGLVLGAGLSFYNYRTDQPYYFKRHPDTGVTVGEPLPEGRKVEKNKITSTFVNIPLLFEWQVPAAEPFHRFYVSAGPYCGFKLGGHTKMVYKAAGERIKDKSKDNINLTPFQYGAMVRIGYRFINLYATYNFSTFYTNNRGPELYPFSIGLSLIQF